MRVYINPGHDAKYDSGAVHRDDAGNVDLRECDVAAEIGDAVKKYLEAAGCECRLLQSDNLYWDTQYDDRPVAVCPDANEWGADVFLSIHCNAFNGEARGTEVECYSRMSDGGALAQCIQDQLINSIDTVDRGVRERPDLRVLRHTAMPAVLVETAFIDNDVDVQLLINNWDDIARAIARGVTDYACGLR
ncbi:N-acetylmuramoyl-L-alanine amidase family protein [Megasphaera massiliensis]|uniref:N-acetylmuramoyl-L-alanine amidase family protein n=1 Tax=Megasphaera massiliensis TaxID=1232428 RepID=UPI0004172933|nr:N-acetylmuramoyl-L-alanine amidase [Megasphaera massiliensis]DAF84484.1 MAG TPA: Cell wall hydrolase autolysin [Caudoviricetes sp.]